MRFNLLMLEVLCRSLTRVTNSYLLALGTTQIGRVQGVRSVLSVCST